VTLDVKSRPDAPSALSLVNVTHHSAHVAWTQGFHGGMDQYFRVKYVPVDSSASDDAASTVQTALKALASRSARYHDVYPANADSDIIKGLKAGERYAFTIMAFNNIGESNYTQEPLFLRTASE
jgi:ABC-type sugar transport system substrate-binding protein